MHSPADDASQGSSSSTAPIRMDDESTLIQSGSTTTMISSQESTARWFFSSHSLSYTFSPSAWWNKIPRIMVTYWSARVARLMSESETTTIIRHCSRRAFSVVFALIDEDKSSRHKSSLSIMNDPLTSPVITIIMIQYWKNTDLLLPRAALILIFEKELSDSTEWISSLSLLLKQTSQSNDWHITHLCPFSKEIDMDEREREKISQHHYQSSALQRERDKSRDN